MKFLVSKIDLVKGLSLGTRSMLVKSSLPILSNILIRTQGKKVEIVTTSLETAARVELDCKVEREGEVTVLGRALVEFVAQLEEGEVIFEKLGEEVVVSCGGTSARFATMPAEEFPAIPKVDDGRKITIAADKFSEAVSRVFFCAAQDESRPILAGVLFEGGKKNLSLVATDGFRLGSAMVEADGTAVLGLKFVMPVRAVAEIPKIVSEALGESTDKKEIELIVAENLNQAVFKMKGIEFTTRLIEGAYPQWEKLIPASFVNKVTVPKEQFTRAIKVASIFAKDAGNIIKFKISGGDNRGVLEVSSNTAQIGSSDSKIEAQVVGVGGEIAFNYRYVLEALGSMEAENVMFEMNESLNPGRLSLGQDKDFFHIIMPVRLQN